VDLRQLRYFRAVAEELSFTRAAERLRIAQPPLSRCIRDLERELGAPLFDRSRRRVAMTNPGRALFEETQAVFDRLALLRTRVQAAAGVSARRLAVGFVSAASYDLLPRLLQRFRETHPAAELDLACLSTDEQRAQLLRGELDLGLAWLPVEDAGITTQPLLREELFVAIPAAHGLARRRAVRPEDLAAWPIAFGCRTRSVASTLTELLRAVGVGPEQLRPAGDLNAAIDMVAAGEGLAIVPRAMRPNRGAHVAYRPLRGAPTLTLGALHPTSAPSALIPAFLAAAQGTGRSSSAA
jgi:DNA-binding transcriptional LysR family regulator